MQHCVYNNCIPITSRNQDTECCYIRNLIYNSLVIVKMHFTIVCVCHMSRNNPLKPSGSFSCYFKQCYSCESIILKWASADHFYLIYIYIC